MSQLGTVYLFILLVLGGAVVARFARRNGMPRLFGVALLVTGLTWLVGLLLLIDYTANLGR